MPLESLPDRFDDAIHQELDRAVNNASKRLSSPLSPFQYSILLNHIVRHSKGDLDSKYLSNEDGETLIDTYDELQDMLSSAWEHRSYREIRNLAILKNPTPPQLPLLIPHQVYHGLSESFQAEYHGAAIEGFYEYLTYNDFLFGTRKKPVTYYAKYCSIVQSSGTGKSRLLIELYKKDVVVLYMNLRGETDVRGFPARDPIPANILTRFTPLTQEEYQTVCYAFLIALFEVLAEQLSTTTYATRQTKTSTMNWVREMCDVSHVPKSTARRDFFGKVLEKYTKIHAELVRLPVQGSNAKTDIPSSDVDEVADGIQGLSFKNNKPFAMLSAVYDKVGASLTRIFANDSNEPKLVIAIDEAHPLTPMCEKGYRPADILCRIINQYSHHADYPIWVVFASTTSKVADFSPPNEQRNSDRVANAGQQIFPPYTQLGWDQSAPKLGDIHVEDVSKLVHIAGYGRPLWRSLLTALEVPSEVLITASSKLCGGKPFDPSNTGHVLAVLGQRFGLSVTFGHPDSVTYLETGVASHLRICLATTLDRNWRFTSYPSEPLLSCAAANDLHELSDNLENALATLLKAVNRGMIDMGQRGELASRLLWLLAKDLYVRASAPQKATRPPQSWNDDIRDCKMISVVDWLEFIFGPHIWDEGNTQKSLGRKTFENAYLNFSHWVCMDAYIAGSKVEDELFLGEWTLRHWQRTSAVQCCHQQPRIDKMVPIYFKDGPGAASAQSCMSQIFISDKARESTDSKDVLRNITRRHENISREGSSPDSDSLPYIAILADLGRPPSFSVTYPERDIDDRYLRIYAAGVDTTTYPFLAKYPALMKTLEGLVHLQQIPETQRPYTEYLNAQVKFGSTASREHMEWERGKAVPPLKRKPLA